MSKTNEKRRQFLKLSAGGLIGMTLGGISLRAVAAEKIKLDDPLAKAMRYTHESEVEGQYCHNCNLIQGEEADWRPCAIFPGKLVANEGWCAAWVKMQ
ncbi:high-potential iron-sulfur protein [Alkalimonas sp.]|uniref:high-potential iron-sulfur protein n=1 Tax=Alkalimonas sp. TaxID=1872453 RepID=UPI00263B3664|nr:high-potential iron-sulfur protein [Alkalimonas sp.]MCC5826365.1 high-potential iron-sulfur protein [Alkalimonas sp.]